MSRKMTKAQVRAVLKRLPDLAYEGLIATDLPLTPKRAKSLEKDHESMQSPESLVFLTKLRDWLVDVKENPKADIRRSDYPGITSHSLAYIASVAIQDHVTNGVLILVMAHLGFQYKRLPGTLNLLFAVSRKSLKQNKALKT